MLATIVRVGNDEYARQNQSYGLTTLQDDHVREDGRALRLEFRGKGGKMHSVRVNDRRLKRIIRSVQDLPGQDLFQYLDADANRQKITSRDINDYLQEISGQPFTAKDFRTPRLGVAVEGHPGRLPKNLLTPGRPARAMY